MLQRSLPQNLCTGFQPLFLCILQEFAMEGFVYALLQMLSSLLFGNCCKPCPLKVVSKYLLEFCNRSRVLKVQFPSGRLPFIPCRGFPAHVNKRSLCGSQRTFCNHPRIASRFGQGLPTHFPGPLYCCTSCFPNNPDQPHCNLSQSHLV